MSKFDDDMKQATTYLLSELDVGGGKPGEVVEVPSSVTHLNENSPFLLWHSGDTESVLVYAGRNKISGEYECINLHRTLVQRIVQSIAARILEQFKLDAMADESKPH